MTATKTNVAAQAGDEPMLLDAVATKIAEFYPQSTPFDMEKNQRLARAILRLPFQRDARDPAAQVSPRATADVERDAARYRWLLDNYARGDGYTDIDAALNEGEPEKYLSPAIDAAILITTKPGA